MSSANQKGTLFQLRCLINRTNVKKKPKESFNACSEFLTTVVIAHVILAALRLFKMETMESQPPESIISSSVMGLSKEERRGELLRLSRIIADGYVSFSYNQPPQVKACTSDKIYIYASELLSMGLFYMEYTDAISEGDGLRVLRCWRYLLPIFKSSRRTNYSIEVFNFLYQYHFTASPMHAEQMLWSRFINTHGILGRNIPCDQHMEHLNRVAKDAIKNLGANKTENGFVRVGKAIGTIVPLIQKFDELHSVASISGVHKHQMPLQDLARLVKELNSTNVLENLQKRHHTLFKTIKQNYLKNVDYSVLTEWIGQRNKIK